MIGYQFLLEVDALYGGLPATLRFCCQPGFSGGGHTWEPRIVNPGLLQINLFSGGKMTGASSHSYGEAVLGNFKPTDTVTGPTDYLKEYEFFGRSIKMYYGPVNAAFPSGFTVGYTAIISAAPTLSWDKVSFPIKGIQSLLDTPLATAKFAGNNALPNGLEGDISLKDKEKPILLGRAFNFPLVLVNSAKLIYAASPITGLSVDEFGSDLHVYDNGVELYRSGKVVNIETDTAPTAGQYTASTSGYIRLGSTPVGPVTCSGAGVGMALKGHPVNLISQVLSLSGKYSELVDTNSLDSFTAYKAVDKAERGIYINSSDTIASILDRIIAPCGYYYFNKDGKIILGAIEDLSTKTVKLAITANMITDFTRSRSTDTKDGIPASYVTHRYRKNYNVNTTPAGSVPLAIKNDIAAEWLKQSENSSGFVHVSAGELSIDTALVRSNSSLIAKTKAIHTNARELIQVTLRKDLFLNGVDMMPGDCVTLDLNGRFGYTATRSLVVGNTINYTDETVRLLLTSYVLV
jgi:hypothetical protein